MIKNKIDQILIDIVHLDKNLVQQLIHPKHFLKEIFFSIEKFSLLTKTLSHVLKCIRFISTLAKPATDGF